MQPSASQLRIKWQYPFANRFLITPPPTDHVPPLSSSAQPPSAIIIYVNQPLQTSSEHVTALARRHRRRLDGLRCARSNKL